MLHFLCSNSFLLQIQKIKRFERPYGISAAMDKKKLELRINKCFTLFDQSFNRVKYFSCITDNISAAVFPKEWEIQNASGLRYKIGEVPQDKEAYLIDGYKHFMQCYLVRDCIESFALSLDNMFFCLLLNGKQVRTDQTLHGCLSNDEKAALETFQKAGISSKEGKAQILKQRFRLELSKDHHKIVSSLKDIRNCLAHTNGIVRETDGKKSERGKREFHWTVFSVFAVGTQSGKRHKIKFNEPFGEEVNVCAQLENVCKSYEIGKPLFFTSGETYEIAWSLQLISQEYLRQINEQLKSALSIEPDNTGA